MTYNLESGKGSRPVTPGVKYPKSRALWVGGQGDLHVVFSDGTSDILFNATGWMSLESVEVRVEGTTATHISAIL